MYLRVYSGLTLNKLSRSSVFWNIAQCHDMVQYSRSSKKCHDTVQYSRSSKKCPDTVQYSRSSKKCHDIVQYSRSSKKCHDTVQYSRSSKKCPDTVQYSRSSKTSTAPRQKLKILLFSKCLVSSFFISYHIYIYINIYVFPEDSWAQQKCAGNVYVKIEFCVCSVYIWFNW